MDLKDEKDSDLLSDLMDIFNKSKTGDSSKNNQDKKLTRDNSAERRLSWQSDASESPSSSRNERSSRSREASQDDLMACLPAGEGLDDDESSENYHPRKGLDSGFHPSSSSEKLDSESVDTLDMDNKSFDDTDAVVFRDPGHDRKDRERTVSSQSFASFTSLSEDDLDFSDIQETENLNVRVLKQRSVVAKSGSMAYRRKPTRAGRKAALSKNLMYEPPTAVVSRKSSGESFIEEGSSSPQLKQRKLTSSSPPASPKLKPASPKLRKTSDHQPPPSPKLRPVAEEIAPSRSPKPTLPMPIKSKPVGGVKIPLGLPVLSGSPPKLRSVRKSSDGKMNDKSPSFPAWKAEVRLKKADNTPSSNQDSEPSWLSTSPNKPPIEATQQLRIAPLETIKIEQSPTLEMKAPLSSKEMTAPNKEEKSPTKSEKEKSNSSSWFDKILRRKPAPSPKPKPEKKPKANAPAVKGSTSNGGGADSDNNNKSPTKKGELKKSDRSYSVTEPPRNIESRQRKSSLFSRLDDEKDEESAPPWMKETRVRRGSKSSVGSGPKDEADGYRKSKDKGDKPSWMKEMMARRRKTQEKLNVKDIMIAKEIVDRNNGSGSDVSAETKVDRSEVKAETQNSDANPAVAPRQSRLETSSNWSSVEQNNRTNKSQHTLHQQSTTSDHDITFKNPMNKDMPVLDIVNVTIRSSSTEKPSPLRGYVRDNETTSSKPAEIRSDMQDTKLTFNVPSSSSSRKTAENNQPESSIPAWKAEIAARRKAKEQSSSPPKSDSLDSSIPPWKRELAAKSRAKPLKSEASPKDSEPSIPPWKQEIAQRKKRVPTMSERDDVEVDWKKELENMKKKPVTLSSAINRFESQC